jgi:hypothetical protein
MQKTSVFSDFYCLPNKLALMGSCPGKNLFAKASLTMYTGNEFALSCLEKSRPFKIGIPIVLKKPGVINAISDRGQIVL